jgi:hypothetical protein
MREWWIGTQPSESCCVLFLRDYPDMNEEYQK